MPKKKLKPDTLSQYRFFFFFYKVYMRTFSNTCGNNNLDFFFLHMREKLDSRIEMLLIFRKEKIDQYGIDLAQFSWQAGDSNNTLKNICNKPQVLQHIRISPHS